MQQLAGFKLYDEQTVLQAFKLREQLAESDMFKSGVAVFIEGVRREEQTYLSQFLNPTGRQSFLNVLEAFKENWIQIQERGVIPAKAKTCAQTLLQVGANPLLLNALSFYDQGRINTFLSYYDYSDGMMEVVGAILGAFTEIEGKGHFVSDKSAFKFLQSKKVLPVSTTKILNDVIKAELKNMAKFFIQDPSGILFLEYFVGQLKEEARDPQHSYYQRILPYQSSELVIAGATFGKSVYKALYRLWEGKGGAG